MSPTCPLFDENLDVPGPGDTSIGGGVRGIVGGADAALVEEECGLQGDSLRKPITQIRGLIKQLALSADNTWMIPDLTNRSMLLCTLYVGLPVGR